MDTPQTINSANTSPEAIQEQMFPILEDLEHILKSLKSLTYQVDRMPELATLLLVTAKEISASTSDVRRKLDIISNCVHHRHQLAKHVTYIPQNAGYIRNIF